VNKRLENIDHGLRKINIYEKIVGIITIPFVALRKKKDEYIRYCLNRWINMKHIYEKITSMFILLKMAVISLVGIIAITFVAWNKKKDARGIKKLNKKPNKKLNKKINKKLRR